MRLGPRLSGPRSLLGAALLGQLAQANDLLASGQVAAAAPVFAELARAAEAAGMPQRAAHLHVQAARSLIQQGDAPHALAHARAALGLFDVLGLTTKANAMRARIIQELQARGFHAEAAQLAQPPSAQDAGWAADEVEAPRGRLPARCASCGAAVRSDEVEWIDAVSAECPYCGSTVQVEA
jgi:hypothetical protein